MIVGLLIELTTLVFFLENVFAIKVLLNNETLGFTVIVTVRHYFSLLTLALLKLMSRINFAINLHRRTENSTTRVALFRASVSILMPLHYRPKYD